MKPGTGLVLFLVGAAAVLVWAKSMSGGAPLSALGTRNTNTSGQPDPTGDLNNLSGNNSSGFNPGGTP